MPAGYLRAMTDLGLMKKARYISGVSGGAWATAVYTYFQSSQTGVADTEEELLGEILQPGEAGGDMDDNENVVPANWTTMPHGGYLRRIAVMHAMGSVGRHADLMPIVVRFLERGLGDPVVNVKVAALKSVKRLLPEIGPSDSLK